MKKTKNKKCYLFLIYLNLATAQIADPEKSISRIQEPSNAFSNDKNGNKRNGYNCIMRQKEKRGKRGDKRSQGTIRQFKYDENRNASIQTENEKD